MIATEKTVRPPAGAGYFYPADPRELRRAVSQLLQEAESVGPLPKGLIVPHAGYVYSGPVAASAYALLKPIRSTLTRVVLLGPCHRLPFYGLATSGAEMFRTPLGTIPLDERGVEAAQRLPQVHVREDAHREEHSLEVQLPFLQVTLGDFSLVPLVIGRATTEEVAGVLEHVWTNDETLVVISTDLSHYHDYWTARGLDSETAHLIERCHGDQLDAERACGFCGVRGLLKVAKERGLHVRTVDLRNSGDTAGDKDRVVGYGSFVVY